MAQSLRYAKEQYVRHFDPKIYLDVFYKTVGGGNKEDEHVEFNFKNMHKFWEKFERPSASKEVRCLEYGGGPVLAYLISAAPKVDRVVFAEFVEANRNAVTDWLAGSPDAHNWGNHIEYFVRDLEGNKDPEAVHEREQELKQKIKSVVHCDATKTPIVDFEEVDVGQPFDVVLSILCLESCVSSVDSYKAGVAKLASFIKPNGYLCMAGALEGTFYCTNHEKFYSLPLTEAMVTEALKEAGIVEIEMEIREQGFITTDLTDCTAGFFVSGKKSE